MGLHSGYNLTFFFKKNLLFIILKNYLFTFGYAGSLLLCMGFL